ncbi:MAG: apolipoprotein N-acyltransferase [Methylococcales bacterium]|jgi:apolipoprotein N-acyltransferase|nr:apolipoprotein N-acyltransferase [Methylococcales bacterium]MBT3698933.1 apolipoprotein N-acyltransferase [Methylococcales bacterium]MBT3816669.1 apolipoprotein N-acyltransferase [Methylococcales bacterium]MBT4032047.1 apolipoprotein N-acyltransferase [Methylococcales bacterium]MBT4348961.1 apolipoprotein N-acyltransferase [Methylococcales bacterium]
MLKFLLRWEFTCFLSGILLALSFSPTDLFYAPFVALALLFKALDQANWKQALFRGGFFGFGFFGVAVSWVFVSIYFYGHAHIVLAVLLTLIFCLFWSLSIVLFATLSVSLTVPGSYSRIFIMPVIWCLVEYFRGQFIFNGFPWLQIAYSQFETPFSGFIPVIGAYGVGFLMAICSSLIVIVSTYKKGFFLFPILILLVSYSANYLKHTIWTFPDGKPLTVTLLQGNVSQDNKWDPSYKDKTLDWYKSKTEQHWDSDLIIWPETAIPAFQHEIDADFLTPLSDDAKRHDTALIVSLPIKNNEKGEYYNAALTLGQGQGDYKKIHLLPFGEYLPLQPLSGYLLDSLNIMPIGSFTPGSDQQPLMRAKGYPFILTICYEAVFGEQTPARLKDARFLVNVTNDGWFGHSLEPYQHMQMARMRALESGRYLLRVTNTGLTAIVGPKGQMHYQAPLFEPAELTGKIIPMAGVTPITMIGDKAIVFIIALFIPFWVSVVNYRKKSSIK